VEEHVAPSTMGNLAKLRKTKLGFLWDFRGIFLGGFHGGFEVETFSEGYLGLRH